MEKRKLEALAAYTKAKRGRFTELAKHLDVSGSYLSQMISGERPMPVVYAAEVEKFTRGAVPKESCRPIDGLAIWQSSRGRRRAKGEAQSVARQ